MLPFLAPFLFIFQFGYTKSLGFRFFSSVPKSGLGFEFCVVFGSRIGVRATFLALLSVHCSVDFRYLF